MKERMSVDKEGIDRRNFLKGVSALAASTAINSLPTDLIVRASAQERTIETSYEKQASGIPTAEDIDEFIRTVVHEKNKQGSTVDLIQAKIFGNGDPLAGIKAFEYTNGIAWNVNTLRGRAQHFKHDTRQLDELYDRAFTIKTRADDAYISFLNQIPHFVMAVGTADTIPLAQKIHASALTLSRCNDSLMTVHDELQKVVAD